jgi:preprotein translocase subunit SecA
MLSGTALDQEEKLSRTMFKNILNTLAGNPLEREIKRYRAVVEQINALEPEMQRRSDDELRDLTDHLRERVQRHRRER